MRCLGNGPENAFTLQPPASAHGIASGSKHTADASSPTHAPRCALRRSRDLRGKPSREGVIEEVLREDPSRVRVRWQDGHTSILTPSAGVARVTPQESQSKPSPR
jgi:Domain of unknown function (DUF1918)